MAKHRAEILIRHLVVKTDFRQLVMSVRRMAEVDLERCCKAQHRRKRMDCSPREGVSSWLWVDLSAIGGGTRENAVCFVHPLERLRGTLGSCWNHINRCNSFFMRTPVIRMPMTRIRYGQVYDVSNWRDHPGGPIIFRLAGQDASAVFTAFHKGSAAHDMLRDRCVGELVDNGSADTPFEKDVRALRLQLLKAGVFQSSVAFYTWKVLSTMAILIAGVGILYNFPTTLGILVSAFVIGLGEQQAGWLSHDFAHQQVSSSRYWNDVLAVCIAGLGQGLHLSWWKDKHNTHHAITNQHETAVDRHDGDPDIDTLPVLAWSRYFLKRVREMNNPLSRFMIRNQVLFFFPLLLMARMSWLYQSLQYALDTQTGWGAGSLRQKPRYPWLERIATLLYYAWLLPVTFCFTNSIADATLFFVAKQFVAGLLLSVAFVVGHNGMECFDVDEKPAFAELQVRTTRDVHGGGLVSWFMGGLEYQIEHHLFPTIPRHQLPKVQPLVESLCKKHNVPYHATGFFEGMGEVIHCLESLSRELDEFPAM